MRKIISVLALSLVVMLASEKTNAQAAPKLYWLDLTPAGISASIQVPVDVKIIEDKYDVLIGDGKLIKIEIAQTSQSFAEVVSFTEKNDIRGFVKFTQKDSNGYIAEMKFMSTKEFDFAYFTSIGGENYLLKDAGSLHHPDVKVVAAMYSYAKTIKSN